MKAIELPKGFVAIVDDEDFEHLAQWRWFLDAHGYASRREYRNGKRVRIMMHRVIMNAPVGVFVDHKNRDIRDNRKENLRICVHSQNAANSKSKSTNRLGIKGVYKRGNKFAAQINVLGKNRHLGTFATAEEANAAYFKAAVEAHGEFARAN